MQSNEQWAKELALVAAILNKAPLGKSIKWGAEVFTYEGKNVVSYGGFKNYFTIWFYNGVFLKDKYKVLVNAQEGKTKSLRQWRFTSIKEVNEKKILEYVQEAIAIEQKGLKIKPEKFKPVEPPTLITAALKKDKALQAAFDKLTPGRQKEYIVYINEAKQDATRQSRLEKIIPVIKQGKGLNDKYK
ncbi:MAG TPA: YdeI/OmpD-associated family protein [Chitinophagaceae bacterium]|nr:YdeI/OmpD-associated family protein [Chitinophagaceae bacterium]